jgi:Big-like domain-containing protein
MEQDARVTPSGSAPRFFLAILVCLVGLVIGVAATHTGVDVLFVALLCVGVIAIERTVGDSLAEFVGPGAAAVGMAGCAFLFVWYIFEGGGKAGRERLFFAAEQRGYHSLWLGVAPDSPERGSPANRAPEVASASMERAGPAASATPPPDSRAVAAATATTGVPTRRVPSSEASNSDLGRRFGNVTTTLLTLSPSLALAGQNVALRAVVSLDGTPLTDGSVEFSVNGRLLATVAVGSSGVAVAQFSSKVPGGYTIRARYSGGQSLGRSAAEATLTILP